jgi:hypothetical protein
MFLSKFSSQNFLFYFEYFYLFSIEDNYVPTKGDTVIFKKMLMPPKNEKVMAVHIKLLHLAEGVKHESWEEAVEHDMEHRRPSRSDSNPLVHEPTKNGDHVLSHID